MRLSGVSSEMRSVVCGPLPYGRGSGQRRSPGHGGCARWQSVSLCAVVAAGLALSASAELTIQDPGTHVVDRAGVISASRARNMESLLLELKKKTGADVKVLVVRSTEGEDVFEFGHRHAELWKLGEADKDNGALIVVAIEQRRVETHTGYGLEGVLPDAWCAEAARELAVPYFKQGDYSEGVWRLAVATANQVADGAGVQLTGVPDWRYRPRRVGRRTAVCGGGFVPLIIILVLLSSLSRRRRHYGAWGGGGLWQGLFWGAMLGNMMGSGRSSWGGGHGGGFGGGSFGGGGAFGGGGGGASW